MKKNLFDLAKFAVIAFTLTFSVDVIASTNTIGIKSLGEDFGVEAYNFLSGGGGITLMVLSIVFGAMSYFKGAGILGLLLGIFGAVLIGYSPDLLLAYSPHISKITTTGIIKK